jgi:hypothetical protein
MSRKNPVVFAIGDMQVDRHDEDFLRRATAMLRDLQPDIVCLTGDECDATPISRHALGTLDEVQVSLQDQIDLTVDLLKNFRAAAPGARFLMAHSNHMERFEKKIFADVLGFHSLRCLRPESLFQMDELGIEYCRTEKEFLPGYLLAHGHQWNFTSRSHMNQGIDVVRRLGASLLAGHCHQPGMRTTYQGVGGSGDLLTYVNAGCSMDFSKAMAYNGGYIRGGSPDWGHAVVVIERYRERNHTNLIIAQERTLRYQGRAY